MSKNPARKVNSITLTKGFICIISTRASLKNDHSKCEICALSGSCYNCETVTRCGIGDNREDKLQVIGVKIRRF